MTTHEDPATKRPVLTVVTVTRNDAAGLGRTLSSLSSQDVNWGLVEHLTIDGASEDNSRALHRELAPPGSLFLSETDTGIYDAMNKGLRHASGDYVQFLNAGDTLAKDDALRMVIDRLTRSRPTWLVAGAVDHHGGARPAERVANLPHIWWRHALGRQPHCHQTCFFSRSLLQQLGGHDESLGFVADFDVVMRFGLIAAPAELDVVVVDYEGGGVSEQRLREIPAALAAVRNKRLGLTGLPRTTNTAVARFQRLRIDIGRRLGR
jgi:glycosyltransferase involved in cell wall biosynthesis